MRKMMIQSSENIGRYIRKVRKELDVTQKDLALTAGTGLRFIIDLENGKPTCQIGKTLQVLQVLGIQLNLSHTEFENEKS
ncbi:helix-turn-helix transcriptional regulator [Legionella pneumophila]|uniref:XRE family transcriptional regulator n=2 Tax=Legionella pneumophila TaxID=446 RepID=A0AAX2J1C0_LEGPN|nr:helix-turn-helix transcriptional regulator [Legionella pneumophila]SQG91174.1 XRE family transcriptional regulator [Legionella pneumophila subsp. pascullei]VEH07720.1 XRE family transcriptional regulator [Legionella pneumophila subsp. pascullei]